MSAIGAPHLPWLADVGLSDASTSTILELLSFFIHTIFGLHDPLSFLRQPSRLLLEFQDECLIAVRHFFD